MISDDVVELGGEWLAPEHSHARRLIEKDLNFTLFHRMYNAEEHEPAGLKIVVDTSLGRKYATSDNTTDEVLPPLANEEIERASATFDARATQGGGTLSPSHFWSRLSQIT